MQPAGSAAESGPQILRAALVMNLCLPGVRAVQIAPIRQIRPMAADGIHLNSNPNPNFNLELN